MIQGTGSGVGKSILVAAFGRIFKEMGFRVAPFKAQNMALNSAVTADGLEMGRAQSYQAEACGLLPDVRMNPILLKPSSDNLSQVILLGRTSGNSNASDYYSRYLKHRQIARNAYDELAAEYDLILIEGAGSPAEINLQPRDLVNMQMAHYAGARVLIVGDIDCGGVFAWMKGTYDLIEYAYKPLVHGFIINKFRGDRSLLEPGIGMFEQMINLPVLGVIPYFRGIRVDEEDSIPLQALAREFTADPEQVIIGVIVPPHIANFTDFVPLELEPDVVLRFLRSPAEADLCDCLILPGSKATLADARYLSQGWQGQWQAQGQGRAQGGCQSREQGRAQGQDHPHGEGQQSQGHGQGGKGQSQGPGQLQCQGWFHRVKSACDRGVAVVGICGGYQMLGEKLFDPYGVESDIKETEGLGLLPAMTTISLQKVLKQVNYRTLPSIVFPEALQVTGYEIHMGQTQVIDQTETIDQTQTIGQTQIRGRVQPLFDAPDTAVGVMSEDRPVLGTYIHGIFDNDQARRSFINWLRQRKGLSPRPAGFSYQLFRQEQLDKLAAIVREHCDMERITGWLRS